MWVTLVLTIKFIGTTLIQGGKRFKGGSRPPEDGAFSIAPAKVLQDFGVSPSSSQARLEDVRWQRIVHNDLENIPLGIIVAWGSLLSCYSERAHVALAVAFCLARILHTWAYAQALQPHRAIFYTIGLVCTLSLALNGLLGFF
uniref:Microsomal glutathione S-transferase 1 n=1 Tax=Arcella intermedia TaxID=1963864 RepID=A0A6B2LPA5_9EUKA